MANFSPVINVMVGAARKAARSLARDFGEVENLQVSLKGPADFVSAADLKAEGILRGELEKARPGYGFVMEEQGVVEGPDKTHRWFVDPLDGTTNFLHGIPHYAISIGLERDGQMVAGLIYNPISDEMFLAEKGQGAFVNNKRLRVSARREMKQALIATGIPFHGRDGQDVFLGEVAKVMGEVSGIRRFGSAALDLAYVAAGRYEAFWERGLGPWDVAAGIIILREAGGRVSDLDGGSDMLTKGTICASNDHLHAPLMKFVGTKPGA